ncbi:MULTISPECIES: cupin domain-containing protein [Pseudonocardia]|uniref:Cupin type-2 domain-containing protein n=2 Tax=Pseudonocardia TaxID=1847 RepID=A0A1Y2MKX6_PSEAH|nr:MULTISPECIES: cupin domain-containing protein [Pseudonocardia]OSY35910.1 hypothetical protein BG845_05748 [Pseudonocardia autotrophica]TDN73982.1 hypothetical protein C8E95_3095 [Pseudonocardia autotrophica]BBG04738.1 hypothetical protein Pdca_59470 [Pseudonocardia autotrophica]GEC28913.1 hypothetical protein PSA01_59420 [Pseudonocardia saturnea]
MHLTTETARTFAMHGVTFTSFAASASGATSLAAWRAEFAPGTPGQTHTMSCEEVLYVMDGLLDVEVDDDSFTARAGDAVLVPAGSAFRISNDSDETARVWATTTLGMTARMNGSGDQIAPPWAQ